MGVYVIYEADSHQSHQSSVIKWMSVYEEDVKYVYDEMWKVFNNPNDLSGWFLILAFYNEDRITPDVANTFWGDLHKIEERQA